MPSPRKQHELYTSIDADEFNLGELGAYTARYKMMSFDECLIYPASAELLMKYMAGIYSPTLGWTIPKPLT